MPLIITDYDGKKYEFDDSQKEFVKRLVKQNVEQECKILELETEKHILEIKLRNARQTADEIVMKSIESLDPER